MLYLEDYLEMIEHLPQELRDRFTEIRELDLSVQNGMDSLDKKQRTFFSQCKRGELQGEAIDAEVQNLRKEYNKVLEDADEKVTIATQVHDLVERYIRRLDSELFKFKCELEADNNGITEILEKRSLEADNSTTANAFLNVVGVAQKENRYFGAMSALPTNSNHNVVSVGSSYAAVSVPSTPTSSTKDNRYRASKPEKRRDSSTNLSTLQDKRQNLGTTITPSPQTVNVVRPITPELTTHTVLNPAAAAAAAAAVTLPSSNAAYNLQQLGASASTAIAAAASQAIVATQQMQQGRRTASLKASYEAINTDGGPTQFWISRDIANAATAAAQNTLQPTSSEKKQKKKLSTNLTQSLTTPGNTTSVSSSAISLASSSSSLSMDSVDMLSSPSVTANVVGVSPLTLSSVTPTSAVVTNRGATTIAAAVSTSSTTLQQNSNLSMNDNGLVVEQTPDGEWSYDPNEPRYCTCNQVSYGDMVACDNEACPYEWFHYPCVGITQPPKGKWYCPKCTTTMRRRGNRKN